MQRGAPAGDDDQKHEWAINIQEIINIHTTTTLRVYTQVIWYYSLQYALCLSPKTGNPKTRTPPPDRNVRSSVDRVHSPLNFCAPTEIPNYTMWYDRKVRVLWWLRTVHNTFSVSLRSNGILKRARCPGLYPDKFCTLRSQRRKQKHTSVYMQIAKSISLRQKL